MTPFGDRMIQTAKLDIHVYEEVKGNKSAMSHWDYLSFCMTQDKIRTVDVLTVPQEVR